MSGERLLDAMQARGELISASTLARHVVPKLKKLGVRSLPKVGYYVDPSVRETLMRWVTATSAPDNRSGTFLSHN
jgi:hypothetical protein